MKNLTDHKMAAPFLLDAEEEKSFFTDENQIDREICNSVHSLYSQMVLSMVTMREEIYAASKNGPIWTFPLTEEHMEAIQTTINGELSSYTSEYLLFLMARDIIIFPELYIEMEDSLLQNFYQKMDDSNDFSVYFLSVQKKNLPIKPHGTAVIGCKSLQKGIAAAGAADPTRMKMILPDTFRKKLEIYFSNETTCIKSDSYNKNDLIQAIREGEHFDSRFLLNLIDLCHDSMQSDQAEKFRLDIQKELIKIIFSYKRDSITQVHAVLQEVWNKPRSSQQHTDTVDFNEEFSRYLETLTLPSWKQKLGHLHHSLTRRVAIREQPDARPSAILRNIICFESEKSIRDKNRTLIYNDENQPIIKFKRFASGKTTANCSAVAVALMDTMSKSASIGNIGMTRGPSLFPYLRKNHFIQKINHFPNPSDTLRIGMTQSSLNLYDLSESKISLVMRGCIVLYDLSIVRRMLCQNKMDDYVWSMVISDKNKIFSHEENLSGWIEVNHLNEIHRDQRNISDIISGSLLFDNDDDPREFVLPVKWMYPHEDLDALRSSEHCTFENGQAFQLGSHEVLVKDDIIYWNSLQIPLADFKGRSILIPDKKMWAKFLNRKIIMADLSDPDKCNKVVAFGTEDDCYMTFPDKFNFMPRRNIKNELTWKSDQYSERQLTLNPRAHNFMGQQLLFGTKQSLKNRREQICEKSGLQIKHAPALFVVNRYIKNHDNFIESFLNGARGVAGADSGDANRPQPIYITDHEIYRLFRGKHSERTLARTVFADDHLIIVAAGKRHETTYNPFHIYCRKLGLNRSDGFVSAFRLD